MAAQTVYNNTASFIIDACKTSSKNMNDFIKQNKFDTIQADIFRQLVHTDGQYTYNNQYVVNSNDLIQKRMDKQKLRHQKLKKKEKNKQSNNDKVDINKYHPKLRRLSCIKNATNNKTSLARRKVADLLNDNIDLDKISNEQFNKISSKLNKIKSDISWVQNRMCLKHMKDMRTLNIKSEIETKKGTTEITHKIDELCSRFVRYYDEYKQCIQKLDDTQIFINDSIIKLDLGTIVTVDGKNKIKPNLTSNNYHFKTGAIKASIKGENIYNFFKSSKREINKIKSELKKDNKSINEKRKNKLYLKYLNKGKKPLSEKERSLRYENGHCRKYKNQVVSGKKTLKKNNNNNKSLKTNKKKKNIKDKNQRSLDFFIKKTPNKYHQKEQSVEILNLPQSNNHNKNRKRAYSEIMQCKPTLHPAKRFKITPVRSRVSDIFNDLELDEDLSNNNDDEKQEIDEPTDDGCSKEEVD